ncbi:Hemicentin-1 [Saguinus oedipus]|uniref:Hemicentin-1 n=1 Tax=Saguinus oedipus TaxID=9490 RepID=A0ABQ9TIN5_SAGOE|nr:Hemicentin-1 [Saguinus oedipus]
MANECHTDHEGGPQRARGSVIGNINDVEFGIAFLNATIADSPNSDTRIIHAKITNVPRSLGSAMRKIVSILNPIYWTTAKEIGEAVNGFTLTNAVFKRETQVEFATGEILRMTHIARGLDSDGALLLDVVVSGYVLQLQTPAEVTVKDYTEDYIQTGPGQLYAYSTRLFTIDGISIPYTWNHTVFYDQARGRMPFLVETLHASSVESDYNQLEETLGFKIHASISKGGKLALLVAQLANCVGSRRELNEDECAAGNPCSHTCHNAMGTYYCSCPQGLTIAADGRTCQDIDECALGRHTCHAGQDCDNTIGSYRCVVHCGTGFRRTSDGLSCQAREKWQEFEMNINECQESSPCHQRCFNVIGSFHCGCEPGYQLKGRKCMDVNECRQNVCRPDQHCKNTRGGYKCIDLCPNGMTKAENGTCIGEWLAVSVTGISLPSTNQPTRVSTADNYKIYKNKRILMNVKMGPISADITRYVRIREAAIVVYAQEVIGLKELEDPAWILMNVKMQMPASMSVRIPLEVITASAHLAINSHSMERHAKLSVVLQRMENNVDKSETGDSYIDECLEQSVRCGPNRMCFNMRGSYQCIDTPCPPNYQRDPVSGFCLKNCPPNDLECALSPYALEYKLVSLPFGIATNQDLIRLVAYTQDGVMHPRTTFLMVDEEQTVPFALRDENLKGVIYTTRPLREAETYRMRVRASSYSANGTIEYQTTFIVYIAVSAYPY